ncbi:17.4 kDa class I heat shock protein-like [Tasmannia lanceolata]|uniref:17.4 kDa class I heat shock protein-like n=1 Tax=Tasmannia lanceolata TaxID=3420 RepID=UPI004062DD55
MDFKSTMKVHPVAANKLYQPLNSEFYLLLKQNSDDSSNPIEKIGPYKLIRTPHMFDKVLELPFNSEAEVFVEENSDCFRFFVFTDDIGDGVWAHPIGIYPGVTKIVIKGGNVFELAMDEFGLDLWRFRLPQSTRPELATAVYEDGELIVTVPKWR